MCKILAVSLLTFSCLTPSEEQLHRKRRPFVCIACSNLRPNNTCTENWSLCYAKRHEACFNRIVIKALREPVHTLQSPGGCHKDSGPDACLESHDGDVLLADRGCTSSCSPLRINQHYRNFTWCCNYRKYCNSRNPWTTHWN